MNSTELHVTELMILNAVKNKNWIRVKLFKAHAVIHQVMKNAAGFTQIDLPKGELSCGSCGDNVKPLTRGFLKLVLSDREYVSKCKCGHITCGNYVPVEVLAEGPEVLIQTALSPEDEILLSSDSSPIESFVETTSSVAVATKKKSRILDQAEFGNPQQTTIFDFL